jgi:hypothetical protein
MNKKWFSGLAFVALSLQFQSCESSADQTADNCIRVKIIDYICAEAVFQILDPAYYHLGELQWGDGDAKYDHVFHSFLGCTDLDYLSKLAAPTVIGKVLDIQVIEKNEDKNCAVCKATIGNAPKTKLDIRFKLEGCN